MAGLKKARRAKEKAAQQKPAPYQTRAAQSPAPQPPVNPFVMGTGNYGGTK